MFDTVGKPRKANRRRQAGASLAPAQIWLTLRKVLTTTELRELAYACVAYVGVQAIFGAFFVAYLVDVMDYDLVLAGQIFAGAQAVSIGARILE